MPTPTSLHRALELQRRVFVVRSEVWRAILLEPRAKSFERRNGLITSPDQHQETRVRPPDRLSLYVALASFIHARSSSAWRPDGPRREATPSPNSLRQRVVLYRTYKALHGHACWHDSRSRHTCAPSRRSNTTTRRIRAPIRLNETMTAEAGAHYISLSCRCPNASWRRLSSSLVRTLWTQGGMQTCLDPRVMRVINPLHDNRRRGILIYVGRFDVT